MIPPVFMFVACGAAVLTGVARVFMHFKMPAAPEHTLYGTRLRYTRLKTALNAFCFFSLLISAVPLLLVVLLDRVVVFDYILSAVALALAALFVIVSAFVCCGCRCTKVLRRYSTIDTGGETREILPDDANDDERDDTDNDGDLTAIERSRAVMASVLRRDSSPTERPGDVRSM